jgi:hypothetical protein
MLQAQDQERKVSLERLVQTVAMEVMEQKDKRVK